MTMATGLMASAPWQTRLVFVSTTTRDMLAKRDDLRQVVFPRVEQELHKGRIQLEPIDLQQRLETAINAQQELTHLWKRVWSSPG